MFGLIGHETFDVNEDVGSVEIVVAVAMMCFSGIAVTLRFVARKIAHQPLRWDDGTILMAIPWAWAVCVVQILAVSNGQYGRHVELATPRTLAFFLKMLYIVQVVYLFAIAMIKFSILLFYRRIFSIPSTRLPAYMIAAAVMGWLIATLLVGIFSCKPVQGFWDKSGEFECVNALRYYLGVAIPNILTDVVLLIFPLPLIWKLNLPRAQKIGLAGVFVLGGFIIVISSLRLVTVIESQEDLDITWVLVPLGIWNAVETNIGITLASLPSMVPLLRLMLGWKPNRPHNRNAATLTSATPRKRWIENWTTYKRRTGSFTRLKTPRDTARTSQDKLVTTFEARANVDNQELATMKRSENGINVESRIEWEV